MAQFLHVHDKESKNKIENNSSENHNSHNQDMQIFSVTFSPLLSDFDRQAKLPVSLVFSWCEEVRMRFIGENVFFRAWLDENKQALYVKSQMCRYLRPVFCKGFITSLFKVEQYIESPGDNSFRFCYLIFENDELIGKAIVVVCTMNHDGTKTKLIIPDIFFPIQKYTNNNVITTKTSNNLNNNNINGADPEGLEYMQLVPKAMKMNSQYALPNYLPSLPEPYPILVRFADQDLQGRINQRAYIEYFEDALNHADINIVTAFWIDYLLDIQPTEQIQVEFISADKLLGFSMQLKTLKGSIICRAWAAHDLSQLHALTSKEVRSYQ